MKTEDNCKQRLRVFVEKKLRATYPLITSITPLLENLSDEKLSDNKSVLSLSHLKRFFKMDGSYEGEIGIHSLNRLSQYIGFNNYIEFCNAFRHEDLNIPSADAIVWENYYQRISQRLSEYYKNSPSFNTINLLNNPEISFGSFPMEEFFVDLCFIPKEELREVGGLMRKEKETSFQKSINKTLLQHRYITNQYILKPQIKTLILGNPGVGKSTYAKWLCYNWVNEPLQDRSILIYIHLPEINFQESKGSAIAELCIKKYFKNDQIDERYFIQSSKHFYFIFDSFDEIKDIDKIGLINEIRNLNILSYVILSRPYGIINHDIPIDTTYEILGFNEVTRLDYLYRFFKKSNNYDLYNPTKKLIEKNYIINEISFNPLLINHLAIYIQFSPEPFKMLNEVGNTFQFINTIFTWIKSTHINKGFTNDDFISAVSSSSELPYYMEIQQMHVYSDNYLLSPYEKMATTFAQIGVGRKEQDTIVLYKWNFYFVTLVYQEFLAASYIHRKVTPRAILYLLDFPFFWNFIRYTISAKSLNDPEDQFITSLLEVVKKEKDFHKYIIVASELPSKYIKENLNSKVEIDLVISEYLKSVGTESKLIIEDSLQKIFPKYTLTLQKYFIESIFREWKSTTLSATSEAGVDVYYKLKSLTEKMSLHSYLFYLDALLAYVNWAITEYISRDEYVEAFMELDENIDRLTEGDLEGRDALMVDEHVNFGEAIISSFELLNKIEKKILVIRKKQVASMLSRVPFEMQDDAFNLYFYCTDVNVSMEILVEEFKNLQITDIDSAACSDFLQKVFLYTAVNAGNKGAEKDTFEFIKAIYHKLENEIIIDLFVSKPQVYRWLVKSLNNLQIVESIHLRTEISVKYVIGEPIIIEHKDDLFDFIVSLIQDLKIEWDNYNFSRLITLVTFSNWRELLYLTFKKDFFALLKMSIQLNLNVLNNFHKAHKKSINGKQKHIQPPEIKNILDRYKIAFLDERLKYDLNDLCVAILKDDELIKIGFVRTYFVATLVEKSTYFETSFWSYLELLLEEKDFMLLFRLLKNENIYSFKSNIYLSIDMWLRVFEVISEKEYRNDNIAYFLYSALYKVLSAIHSLSLQETAQEFGIKVSEVLTGFSLDSNFFKYRWIKQNEEGNFWIFPLIYFYTWDSELLKQYDKVAIKGKNLETIARIGSKLFNMEELEILKPHLHSSVYMKVKKIQKQSERDFSVSIFSKLLAPITKDVK